MERFRLDAEHWVDADQEFAGRVNPLAAELAARAEPHRNAGAAAVVEAHERVLALSLRVAVHRSCWVWSAREVDERGWTDLCQGLEDGVGADGDSAATTGLAPATARQVLGVCGLAVDHGTVGEARDRLDGLLSVEAGLLEEHRRLREMVTRLRVSDDVRTAWTRLRLELHATCAWIVANRDAVAHLTHVHAPDVAAAVEPLLDALDVPGDGQASPDT